MNRRSAIAAIDASSVIPWNRLERAKAPVPARPPYFVIHSRNFPDGPGTAAAVSAAMQVAAAALRSVRGSVLLHNDTYEVTPSLRPFGDDAVIAR